MFTTGFFRYDSSQDVNRQAIAHSRFNDARTALLIALALTVVNIILLFATGGSLYLLFTLTLPYYAFAYGLAAGIAAAVITTAFYVCCYLFSKKKPLLMIWALVAFSADCLLNLWVGFLMLNNPHPPIAEILPDLIVHVCILIYLIIGVRSIRRMGENRDASEQIKQKED